MTPSRSGLSVVLASLIWFGSATGAINTAPPPISDPHLSCVRPTSYGPDAPERALAAARRFLKRLTLTNQSGTIHLTPRNYAVDGVTRVSGYLNDRTANRYWALVRNRCDLAQADATWLVLVELTQAQLPLPPLAVLVTPSAKGWVVTMHRLDSAVRTQR